MILAVDIGNTTIGLGVCQGTRILSVRRVDTVASKRQLAAAVSKCLGEIRRWYPSLRDAVICSVVPRALATVESVLRRQFGARVVVIGRDIPVPIKNNYRDPRQVGQDRLVGAYAAQCLYRAPCLIIDFGTAITFDIVSRRGEYEGGIIIPGLRLSAESLFQKTALLPRIDTIRAPRSLIGKDTRESILSGLFNGYGAMCAGLIDQVAGTMSRRPKVIITGGHTRLMQKFIRTRVTAIDKDLVFKGIALVSQNKKNLTNF
ncbi:MAG: type III pantothenate kinase [Candidatus Omnitrophica bacterium]|nr:type III pantothenate kinase [Candidatus Omnitrophota bacterium]